MLIRGQATVGVSLCQIVVAVLCLLVRLHAQNGRSELGIQLPTQRSQQPLKTTSVRFVFHSLNPLWPMIGVIMPANFNTRAQEV